MWRNMHFISRVYLREINVPLYFTRMYNICDRVRSRVMLISNRSHRHPFSQPKKRDIYAGSDTYLIRVLIRHQITMQRISILSCGTYIFLLLREFGKTKSGCSSQPNSRSRVRQLDHKTVFTMVIVAVRSDSRAYFSKNRLSRLKLILPIADLHLSSQKPLKIGQLNNYSVISN